MAYDPNEPRDDQGRWTDSGGTSSGVVGAAVGHNAGVGNRSLAGRIVDHVSEHRVLYGGAALLAAGAVLGITQADRIVRLANGIEQQHLYTKFSTGRVLHIAAQTAASMKAERTAHKLLNLGLNKGATPNESLVAFRKAKLVMKNSGLKWTPYGNRFASQYS